MSQKRIPKGWSSSILEHALVCDFCQQKIGWRAWDRGDTLAHHADGRWATAPGESDLCPSSPGYRPASPLESGVRELIINTAGVSVPVRVGDVSEPGAAVARGTERSHDWTFVGVLPALADLHGLVANFLASNGYAPKCIEVSADDHRRLSDDCAAMQPSTDVRKATDEHLVEELLRRNVPTFAAVLSDEKLRAELARRNIDGVVTLNEIIRAATDDELRAEYVRRGMICEVGSVTHAIAIAQRDEARARVASLEARIAEGYVPTIARLQRQKVLDVAQPGCAACGAPRGEPCTSSCEDAGTPDAMVVSWGPGHSRAAREGLRLNGQPVSQLPPPKPPTRPDNSVAHLDVDLLADDA